MESTTNFFNDNGTARISGSILGGQGNTMQVGEDAARTPDAVLVAQASAAALLPAIRALLGAGDLVAEVREDVANALDRAEEALRATPPNLRRAAIQLTAAKGTLHGLDGTAAAVGRMVAALLQQVQAHGG